MDYESVKAKLDNLVEAKNLCDANKEITRDICTCSQLESGIHIFCGIEELAEIMGFELKETTCECGSFPYQYEFIYRDVTFFQISSKRFPGYAE